MNRKISIRKVLFVAMWLVIGGGMLTLLIAAMGRQKTDTCKDYSITIKGVKGADLFLDEKDVTKLLEAAAKGKIRGQRKELFNLRQMEQLLEDNNWVKDAELYFDNRDVLHVQVTERQPIARIFTTADKSFYIDDSGQQLPLSDKISARLPVFTGFPAKKVLTAKDSALLKDIVGTASFIANDPFWMAQVSQVAIQLCGYNCWNFEMTPLVGNHTVRLGNGTDIDKKFRRLYIFYKQVLSKTGFDKYKSIDVAFAGQVIGVKGTTSKIDSIQLKKNVEALLKQSREMNEMMEVMPVVDLNTQPLVPNAALGENVSPGEEMRAVDTTAAKTNEPVKRETPVKANADAKPATAKPVKPKPKPAVDKKPVKQVKQTEGSRPKAVMPKR